MRSRVLWVPGKPGWQYVPLGNSSQTPGGYVCVSGEDDDKGEGGGYVEVDGGAHTTNSKMPGYRQLVYDERLNA